MYFKQYFLPKKISVSKFFSLNSCAWSKTSCQESFSTSSISSDNKLHFYSHILTQTCTLWTPSTGKAIILIPITRLSAQTRFWSDFIYKIFQRFAFDRDRSKTKNISRTCCTKQGWKPLAVVLNDHAIHISE